MVKQIRQNIDFAGRNIRRPKLILPLICGLLLHAAGQGRIDRITVADLAEMELIRGSSSSDCTPIAVNSLHHRPLLRAITLI
jgi:hypothetical protein